jgi:hypothetical protein
MTQRSQAGGLAPLRMHRFSSAPLSAQRDSEPTLPTTDRFKREEEAPPMATLGLGEAEDGG